MKYLILLLNKLQPHRPPNRNISYPRMQVLFTCLYIMHLYVYIHMYEQLVLSSLRANCLSTSPLALVHSNNRMAAMEIHRLYSKAAACGLWCQPGWRSVNCPSVNSLVLLGHVAHHPFRPSPPVSSGSWAPQNVFSWEKAVWRMHRRCTAWLASI